MKYASIGLFAGLLAACGDGAPAPGNEPAGPTPAEPTITLLTPSASFPTRSVVLQISGAGTHFGADSVVSFDDPEIKATMVAAGSKGNLRIFASIGEKARLGPHTVTVTTPGAPAEEVASLTEGFHVQASLVFETPAGGAAPASVQQGGIVPIAVRNLDFQLNPFNGTRVSAGGRSIANNSVATARYSALVLVDPLAPAGSFAPSLSGLDPLGNPVTYVADPRDTKAVQVTARAATPLAVGAPRSGDSIGAPGQTNLYKLKTTEDDQILTLSYSGFGPQLGTGVSTFFAPASGRFIEGGTVVSSSYLGTQTALQYVARAGDVYLSVMEPSLSGGATGFGYTVTPQLASGRRLSLKEPMVPDSPASPMIDIPALDGPYFAVDGAIDTNTDMDYIRFKATTGRVYVQATSTAGFVAMDLYNITCGGVMMNSGNVQIEMAVTPGTTYCLRLSYNPARPYQLLLVPGT